MKHIIEEHLDTIVEGAGAVGIIVIFTALFLNGAGSVDCDGIRHKFNDYI